MKININNFPRYQAKWEKSLDAITSSQCQALCREIAHSYVSNNYDLPNPVPVSHYFSDFVISTTFFKILKKNHTVEIKRTNDNGTFVYYK